MNGKHEYMANNPRLLLDASLSPAVARALAEVGWDIIASASALESQSAPDPEIIEWCRQNDAVWIHADDRARRQHRVALQTSGIKTVWVNRKDGKMSSKEQLRVIAFVLPILMQNWQKAPRQRHYRVTAANEVSKPSVRPFSI